MEVKENSSKDGLGQDIENTVEDGLRVGVDNVGSFADAPSDRVQEPEEEGPDTTNQECSVYIFTESHGVFPGRPDEVPCNGKESCHGEHEVTPLVRRADQSANETSDDHDFVE